MLGDASPKRFGALTLRSLQAEKKQTDYAGALEVLRRVQAENPLNPDLLLWIAHCLRAGGQNQQALEVLDQGRQAPSRKCRHSGTGAPDPDWCISEKPLLSSSMLGQWKAALRELTALAEMADEKPGDATTLFQIAYCHQQLGNLKEALRHYHAGLQADPQASWARQNLAVILYQLGRYQEAANEWERVPAKLRSPEIWQQLGFCYAYLGRYEAAESFTSNRAELWFSHATAALPSGRHAPAQNAVRRRVAPHSPLRCGQLPAGQKPAKTTSEIVTLSLESCQASNCMAVAPQAFHSD